MQTDFVAIKESVSVREAAIRISEWFGLSFDVPTRKSEPEKKSYSAKPAESKASGRPDRESQDSGPNKPLGFQLQNLDATHPYLTERGLTPETIAEFGLGFCANGSMKGRVVIPIHNLEGKLLAYAGRWPGQPPDEDTPKYKLPAGFRKSQELFNLHRAIQESPDQPLVIVEGFFDCIKLWQLGVKRVVALMGSTLSPAQEQLIRKHTNATGLVLVILDEDDAGRAGRAAIASRLSRFCYVKVQEFEEPGTQPEHLSADEVAELLGGAP